MRRRRVLIVEDDPHYQDLLTHLLTSAGYGVTATDAALGTTALVEQVRPHVILLDLGLPYRSGASFLATLKADPETSDIPVLVVSGDPETLGDERRDLVAGVFQKPLELRVLLDAVRAAASPIG